MKPDVLMIQMPHNPISMYYRGRIEESWSGYNVKYFDAVTPETMDNLGYLRFAKKRDVCEFTETEKATWYSHVECWAMARRKPLLIIEHDAMLDEPIDDDLWGQHDIICFGRQRKGSPSHQTVSPFGRGRPPKAPFGSQLAASAYYLTPNVAKKLVSRAKKEGVGRKGIDVNPDCHIHVFCDKLGVWRTQHVYQLVERGIGTTIKHNR